MQWHRMTITTVIASKRMTTITVISLDFMMIITVMQCDVYWCVLMCTDTVYWYCVLILCTDTVCWYCVLILMLCTDTVYSCDAMNKMDQNCWIQLLRKKQLFIVFYNKTWWFWMALRKLISDEFMGSLVHMQKVKKALGTICFIVFVCILDTTKLIFHWKYECFENHEEQPCVPQQWKH